MLPFVIQTFYNINFPFSAHYNVGTMLQYSPKNNNNNRNKNEERKKHWEYDANWNKIYELSCLFVSAKYRVYNFSNLKWVHFLVDHSLLLPLCVCFVFCSFFGLRSYLYFLSFAVNVSFIIGKSPFALYPVVPNISPLCDCVNIFSSFVTLLRI